MGLRSILMSILLVIMAILCFAAIFAYWYFLPYQCILALNGSPNLWGILAYTTALIITLIVGIPLTLILIMAAITLFIIISDISLLELTVFGRRKRGENKCTFNKKSKTSAE